MKKYLAYCSYVGKTYCGFQSQTQDPSESQPRQRSEPKETRKAVQDALEEVISKFNREKTFIQSSGRTDADVNAYRMPFVFVLNRTNGKELSVETIKKAFNYHLDENKEDISIVELRQVPLEFDVKKHAKQKEYVYRVEANLGEIADYIQQRRKCVWSIKESLDLDKLKLATELFIGTHDFKHFIAPAVVTKKMLTSGTVRKIDEVQICPYFTEFSEEQKIQAFELRFKAKSFLKYQVRKMTRAIVAIALGKSELETIKKMLDDADSVKSDDIIIFLKEKAPGHGLFLKDVKYDL